MTDRVSWRAVVATFAACLTVGVVVVVLAVNASEASATHLAGGYYHYSLNECPYDASRRTDPINVMFYNNATAYNSRVHVNHHTGWEPTDFGATANFQVQTNCGPMNNQLAENCCTARYHVRYRESPYYDFNYGTVTMATPHHENVEPCTAYHKVDPPDGSGSGYDKGRAKVYQQFSNSSHHVYGGLGDWGSTAAISQCGQDVAGDGRVGWWRID